MCIRPDIVYVVSEDVMHGFLDLLDEGYFEGSRSFFNACTARAADESRKGQWAQARMWRTVRDFGARVFCSPLSAIEVNGTLLRQLEPPCNVREDDLIRLYIGDPRTPAHVPGQGAITKEAMDKLYAA